MNERQNKLHTIADVKDTVKDTVKEKSSLSAGLIANLSKRLLEVRAHTEALAEPLSPEDQCIQSMVDVSPTKWHRAHTSWFFETFILSEFKEGYKAFDPDFCYLFNSYYESVGPRHERPQRGLITRPSADEVSEYRKYVDGELVDLLENLDNSSAPEEVLKLVVLGINHEQQHQELILSDIKCVLFSNPKLPVYLEDFELYKSNFESKNQAGGFERFIPQKDRDGRFRIGNENGSSSGSSFDFSFDNEFPVHEVILQDFELGKGCVTTQDWLEFMADGGYETPTLWLSDGWQHIQETKWMAPEYFIQIDGDWKVFTLSGLQDLDPMSPIMHVSYYEADAFARWAGARLPTEFEWEYVAKVTDQELPGAVWEWTGSSYSPYPGFAPVEGAVGEYNGKFMVNQKVLRGGCWATPDQHIRPTYRNFYSPKTRWHFSGLRLAKDIA